MPSRAAAHSTPKRLRWRFRIAAAGLVLLAILAALPELVRTPPVRRWLLARINQALAPGRLEVSQFRASWLGPTILEKVHLFDARNRQVAEVPRASWDSSVLRILLDRPRLGTLTLVQAKLDLERRPDGVIDLVEALGSVLDGPEATDLTVRIERGSLRFQAPGIIDPIVARWFDLTLHRPPAPRGDHLERGPDQRRRRILLGRGAVRRPDRRPRRQGSRRGLARRAGG